MFIQPVSMPCTKEQFEKYLKKRLVDAGYDIRYACHSAGTLPYIGTNFVQMPTRVGFISKSSINKNSRYYIPDFNAELFLAIAFMTNEKYGIPGEYWTYQGISNKDWYNRKPYQSVLPANKFAFITTNVPGKTNGTSSHEENLINFKKSTLKELVNELSTQMESKTDVDGVFTITRQELGEINEMACPDWKIKLEIFAKIYGKPFENNIFLPEKVVREMFDAATSSQIAVLEKIFPTYTKDKNLFSKHGDVEKRERLITTMSKELFGDPDRMELAHRAARLLNKPDLINRSLWFRNVEVRCYHLDEGTLVELIDKRK